MFRFVVSLLSGVVVLWGCGEEAGKESNDRGEGEAFLVGIAEVRDGDSLRLAGEEVRLLGIDAPEYDQECGEGQRVWRCGEMAKEMLEQSLVGRELRCAFLFRDAHDRWLSRCFLEEGGEGRRQDLGKMMVRRGMAVATSKEYRALMQKVKKERVGIWGGCLEKPKRWRKERDKGAGRCWHR